MIGFLLPRYVKNGREMLKAARKMLHYKRDLLSPEEVARVEAEMASLKEAIRNRQKEAVEQQIAAIDGFFAKRFPVPGNAALRENCEVILVALVITLGIRSFFLQPFTIPTGSMQPTLNGIRAYVTETPPPALPVRVLHMALFGRSYVDVISQEDDVILQLRPVKRFGFFNYTEVRCQRQTFLVHSPMEQAVNDFRLVPGRTLRRGEVVARGYVNTGDHVFVDKMRYNFVNPKLDDVFVFNTQGIKTGLSMENPDAPSQYYIKRLAGLPGDKLQIIPPKLYINGEVAKGWGFDHVMSEQGGYRGYSNTTSRGERFPYLGSPEQTFIVPERSYFALGDNSYNSADSRSWGVVPESNVTGKALFVYWPFTSHWGFIK